MNNPDLLQRLKNGEEAAFKELVTTHEVQVYNTALNIVHKPEDANDITQEVFVQAYTSLKDFKGEASLGTWLYKITINKSLDHRKKEMRKQRLHQVQSFLGMGSRENTGIISAEHPGFLLENKEEGTLLLKAIKKLPEKQELVFTLHKMNQLSYRDIADVLDLSLPAVESLMVRAKKNLQNILAIIYSQSKK
ncbi:MAG: RNA polymerase sigma factor [Ferruginibacter sp.]